MRLHRADGGHVVHRENRRRARFELQDLLRRPVTADLVDRGLEDQARPNGKPASSRAAASPCNLSRPVETSSASVMWAIAAVADREEVLAHPARAGDVVERDAVAVEVGDMAVDEDQGKASLHEPEEVAPRPVADRSDDEALYAMRYEVADIVALEPQVALAVAQKDAVAGLARRRLRATHDRGEERVRDVGNDQADRLGLRRDEAAGDPAGSVVERGDRLLDLAACLGSNARLAVDDPRDAHRGDAGQPCHILYRRTHRPTASPCCDPVSAAALSCHRASAPKSPARIAPSSELVDRHGQEQHGAACGVLVEGRDIHQAHAVVEAAHQQGADERAEDPAPAARERGAADDRGGDGVELEEEAGTPADGAADPRRQRDAGDAVAEAGDEEVAEDRPADIDARQPRRLRVAADGVELRAEPRAAHHELGGDRAGGDEEDEVGDALP